MCCEKRNTIEFIGGCVAGVNLTYDVVSGHIRYCPLSGSFYRRSRRVGKWRPTGFSGSEGYVIIYLLGRQIAAARIAYLLMTGEWPEYEVDHKNLNRGDNRWSNLRHAKPSQNCANKGRYENNSSGFKGVHEFFSRGVGGRWRARIGVNGRRISLGLFDSPEAAHAAYVAASEMMHKEFSRVE